MWRQDSQAPPAHPAQPAAAAVAQAQLPLPQLQQGRLPQLQAPVTVARQRRASHPQVQPWSHHHKRTPAPAPAMLVGLPAVVQLLVQTARVGLWWRRTRWSCRQVSDMATQVLTLVSYSPLYLLV
jgi:hypothetical protein